MTIQENGDTVQWGISSLPTSWSGGAYFIVKSFGGDYWNESITESRFNDPATLPISGEMGSQFTGNMNFYEFGLPLEEWGVDRDAFEFAFYELPRQHGIAPVYHPKYLEWETSIYSTTMDPLWVGEERDAAVACNNCHEMTNQLLAG